MSGEPSAEPVVGQVTQFYVYSCKECKTYTTDPVNHSITAKHFQGFKAIAVPIETEQTKEQVAAEKEVEKKAVDEVAGKVLRTAGKK